MQILNDYLNTGVAGESSDPPHLSTELKRPARAAHTTKLNRSLNIPKLVSLSQTSLALWQAQATKTWSPPKRMASRSERKRPLKNTHSWVSHVFPLHLSHDSTKMKNRSWFPFALPCPSCLNICEESDGFRFSYCVIATCVS